MTLKITLWKRVGNRKAESSRYIENRALRAFAKQVELTVVADGREVSPLSEKYQEDMGYVLI